MGRVLVVTGDYNLHLQSFLSSLESFGNSVSVDCVLFGDYDEQKSLKPRLAQKQDMFKDVDCSRLCVLLD